MTNRHVKVRR